MLMVNAAASLSEDIPHRIRAAQYVRMSTEHQKYSTENQVDAIAQYAGRRGFEIVRTYEDSGKSGLRLEGRQSLRQLIADVCTGSADFGAILVYDVSRWGRFQDADEGAHYEFICREAGVAVEYCAEQFDNDGSMSAAIIKNVKRLMAAEYSRELSTKVFLGQCRLVRMGFRQGGSAGFGLRRLLIDEHRTPKLQLGFGERKSLLSDRVILQLGPPAEVEAVRGMYRMFVFEKRSEFEIATSLNAQGVLTDQGRLWSRNTVRSILTNEKYIGNNVFNRRSFKLQIRRAVNSSDTWVRNDSVFEPIVDAGLFAAVRRIILERRPRYTEQALLDHLAALLAKNGRLSQQLIDKTRGVPCCETYRQRFGSLARAWKLIGYAARRDFRFVDVNKVLRARRPSIVSQVVTDIEGAGGTVRRDPKTGVLTIDEKISAFVVIVRSQPTKMGTPRWYVSFKKGPRRDVTIVVRIASDDVSVRDYYVLPQGQAPSEPNLYLHPENGVLEAFRCDTLGAFFEITRRSDFEMPEIDPNRLHRTSYSAPERLTNIS
jgi:DNA invertase Pin-like site-specific DNA recombinase